MMVSRADFVDAESYGCWCDEHTGYTRRSPQADRLWDIIGTGF